MISTRKRISCLWFVFLLLQPTWFSWIGQATITVQNEGIVQDTYTLINDTAVSATREVILNIVPDVPHLQSWCETIVVTTSQATLRVCIQAPYWEYQIVQVGQIPAATTEIEAVIQLVDTFASTDAIQERDSTFLEQLARAFTVPAGVNSTLRTNTSILTTLVNRVDQIAAQQINDTAPMTRRRRLLQFEDTENCFTTGNMQCILAACGTGLTNDFASELFDICLTPNATLQFRNLTEEDYRNELECLIAGSCHARIQCSPPPGQGSGVDEVCAQAVLSQVRADQAVLKRADQAQKLAFFQNFFQNATSLLKGYNDVAQILADQIDQQNSNVNATLEALASRRQLLTNVSLALQSIQEQTDSMATVVSDFTTTTSQLFEQHGALMIQVVNQVADLTTVNANLKLVLQSTALSLQEANTLAQLHLVSQAQAAAMSNSIWTSIMHALEELMVRSQVTASLSTQVQGLILNREAEGAFRLWSADRGAAPRLLAPEERYQRLVELSFIWVADINDTRRVTMDMFCDLQKFVQDTDPRTSISFIPNWFITPGTQPCYSAEGQAFLQEAMTNRTAFLQDANITSWFPAFFDSCKCIIGTVEEASSDPSAMDFVTFVPPTHPAAPADDASNHNGSSDPFVDVLDSFFDTMIQSGAVLNRSSLFDFLGSQVCFRTDTLAATLMPWNVSYVPVKIVRTGFPPDLVLLDPVAENRSSCSPDPTRIELWVQPELTQLSLGPPFPLVVYQHMLLAMRSFESLIDQGYILSLGRLPSDCEVETSTQQFSTLNTTTAKNSIALTNNQSYEQDSPFGYESHTVRCGMVSLTSPPVYSLVNKRLVLDGSITLQDVDGIDYAAVLDTRLFNVPSDALPWQWYLVGESGCYRNPCPVLPTYVDPVNSAVVGVLASKGSDLIATFDGNTPGAEFSELNPDHVQQTGFDFFVRDIPQRYFSTSSNLNTQYNKVTALLYKQNADMGAGTAGINSLSAQRLDTTEGPYFQRLTVNFSEWKPYVQGEFRPGLHASMGAQLFNQKVRPTAWTDVIDDPPNLEQVQRFPNYTSIACTGTRRAGGSGDSLCAILDRFEMDFSVERGTARFYPRGNSYHLQVVALVRAQQDNTSIPYAIRPASSESLGRQITRCPETISIKNKEVDFTEIHIGYYFLPELPRLVRINASSCSASSLTDAGNQTGAINKVVRVVENGSRFNGSQVQPFSTVTISIAGCANQVVIVTVEPALDAPDYGVAPKNTCLVWQAQPLTQSIETVRANIAHVVQVQNDQLAQEIRTVGGVVSLMSDDPTGVAQRAIQLAFAVEYNATAHQIMETELNSSLDAVQALKDATDADLSQVHSLGLGMLSLISQIRTQIAGTRLDPTNVVAYLQALASTEGKYRDLIATQEIIVAAFQKTINVTRDLARNLTAVSFVFANAPANFSWEHLGYMITMFGQMECPARLDQWKRALYKEARDHFRCRSGWILSLGCLNGELTFVRFLIYGTVWSGIATGLTFMASASQYGIRMCPRVCHKNSAYNKALWATSTKSAPHAASYVRPIIVQSLVYVVGALVTVFVYS